MNEWHANLACKFAQFHNHSSHCRLDDIDDTVLQHERIGKVVDVFTLQSQPQPHTMAVALEHKNQNRDRADRNGTEPYRACKVEKLSNLTQLVRELDFAFEKVLNSF